MSTPSSVNVKRTSFKPRIPPTPVCKYCKNLNNPDIPFDHWLRETSDPKSPIICPVLKHVECTWCLDEGHTKKYCKDFISFVNGHQKVEQRLLKEDADVSKEQKYASTNGFNVLCDDSDDDDKEIYAKSSNIKDPVPISKEERLARISKTEQELVDMGVIVHFPTSARNTTMRPPPSPTSHPPKSSFIPESKVTVKESSPKFSKEDFPELSSTIKKDTMQSSSTLWESFRGKK
jgi:hypothetical protein